MTALSEDIFYQKIGEKIRDFRLKAGIGQELFSELLNLTRASVVNIEKGRQRPSIYMLIIIGNILKIDYIDLIPYDLSIKRIPVVEKKLKDIDYSALVASSDMDLNERVKNSMSQFMSQIKK